MQVLALPCLSLLLLLVGEKARRHKCMVVVVITALSSTVEALVRADLFGRRKRRGDKRGERGREERERERERA